MINYALSDAGYPVIHFHKPDSLICEARVLVKCGSSHEDPDSYGVGHFLEHMCFQGTPTKNKHQISREMSLIGDYNASTNYFCTDYYFTALNESFDRGFFLLKESVFDSCFPEHEFEKEKSVILEEWRMYDNYPSEHYNNFLLTKHFGQLEGHPIIGYQESIEGMTPEKLHRYRDKWYGRQNIAIIVVGGIPFDQVMTTINRHLGPSKEVQPSPICLSTTWETDTVQILETDRFEQAIYGHIQPWFTIKHLIGNNYVEGFMLKAMITYLYECLRDDLGLCYGIHQRRLSHGSNSFLISTMLTSKGNIEKVEAEFFKCYQKVIDSGFPEDIFNIAKAQASFHQLLNMQDVSGISGLLMNIAMFDFDPDWIVNKASVLLDGNWMKKKAADLKPKNLQDFAAQNLGFYSRYSMIPASKE